jgi:ribonuclease P protein component
MSRQFRVAGRSSRLTRRSEFQRLTQKGRSWGASLLVLKALPNSLPATRCGFSVSKAVGNAVSRNRVKRQLRECMRLFYLRPGWDILIIARPAVKGRKFADIRSTAVQLLERARLMETKVEDTGTGAD